MVHAPDGPSPVRAQSEEQARIVRSFAYNQGFYNLFLTAGAVIGLVWWRPVMRRLGAPWSLFACGSMVAAGIVLVTHNRSFVQAAAIQIVPRCSRSRRSSSSASPRPRLARVFG